MVGKKETSYRVSDDRQRKQMNSVLTKAERLKIRKFMLVKAEHFSDLQASFFEKTAYRIRMRPPVGRIMFAASE